MLRPRMEPQGAVDIDGVKPRGRNKRERVGQNLSEFRHDPLSPFLSILFRSLDGHFRLVRELLSQRLDFQGHCTDNGDDAPGGSWPRCINPLGQRLPPRVTGEEGENAKRSAHWSHRCSLLCSSPKAAMADLILA